MNEDRVVIDPFTGMPTIQRVNKEVKVERRAGGGGGVSSPSYTSSDFDSDFANKTTDDLPEGSANLYDQPQGYNYFIYNSSGSQENNRFNDWDDLITALSRQEGAKIIQIEQDETIPPGAYNLDDVGLRGNSLEYNAGGYTYTFGDNTTITGWRNASIEGVRILSTSTTGNIFTTANPFQINMAKVSHVHSTSVSFFKFTGSGQFIFFIDNNARFEKLSGGVENLDCTSPAFSAQLVMYHSTGAIATNDTLKSTNAQIFVSVLGTVSIDPNSFPTTHTNLVVGVPVVVRQPNSGNLVYDNGTSGLAANDVQAAIDEIADPSDTYTVTNDSTARSLDADTLLLGDVADTLATLIKDLQNRSIIG